MKGIKRLLTLGFFGLVAYIGLPYLLLQVLNWDLVREGKRAKREIALTFDDGPDPTTTPMILDALKTAQMKATFFVLAEQAETYPEIIQRMLDEGHQVEAHAVKHLHAWLRTPWGAMSDPVEAVKRIQKVTGKPVYFHRPPHGGYSLATWLGQKRVGVTGAHWSIQADDWATDTTPELVRQRLNAQLVPGAIIVLHDAGPGAKNTVPAIAPFLTDLQERGYKSVILNELEDAKPLTRQSLLRRVMLLIDDVFDQMGNIRPAGGRADNLFRVARLPFPQSDVKLKNGTTVPQGVPAIEYHVNNPQMVDEGIRIGLRRAPKDLRDLAHELETRPEWQDVEVIFCLSSLAPLLKILGFETHDLPTGFQGKRLRGWTTLLRLAYGSDLNARETKLSILSRADFLKRYGTSR